MQELVNVMIVFKILAGCRVPQVRGLPLDANLGPQGHTLPT